MISLSIIRVRCSSEWELDCNLEGLENEEMNNVVGLDIECLK